MIEESSCKKMESLMEGNVSNCPEKMLHLTNLSKGKKKMLQVGFNGGHSAEILLNGSDPNSTLISFDIGVHSYVNLCKNEIEQKFPNRHTLILGDSLLTLPSFTLNNLHSFDLIFIDGGHTYEIASSDINCAFQLGKSGGTIIVDDVILLESDSAKYSVGPTKSWLKYSENLNNVVNNTYRKGKGMSWGFLN